LPTINLVVYGPPASVNQNLTTIVNVITASGVTLNGEISMGGEGQVTSDPTILTGLTVAFRGRVGFPLVGTRAQFDALKVSLQTIKTASPALGFAVSLDEATSL